MPVIETKGAASSGGFGQFARQVAANYIEDVFSTWLYTGNSAGQTIANGIDLAGKGGLVWIKDRFTSYGQGHVLLDSARGTSQYLQTQLTNAQGATTGGGTTSFLSNGFSFSGNVVSPAGIANYSGFTLASWTFRKQAKFFDVVTYTGNGTVPRSISHSLESVPGFIAIKCTSAADNWICRHRSTGDTPNDMTNYTPNSRLFLNTTGGAVGSPNIKADASTFTVNHVGDLNTSGQTYVAYIFAHNAGGFGAAGTDNVISCGSYVGAASAISTVNLGYEPQWLIVKRTDGGGGYADWYIFDNMRGVPTGDAESSLSANSSAAETTSLGNVIDFTATGFSAVNTSGILNSSGTPYIYIAIRRGPMRAPTSGTSVFGMQTYADASLGSTAPIVLGSSVGFPVDTAISAIRTSGAANINRFWGDRLRGRPELYTTSTAAEGNTDIITWGWQAGLQVSTAGNWYYFDGNAGSRTFVGYFFRRAPGFFDVVCYTGTGSNTTVNHSLGVVPEMILLKDRTTAGTYFCVYHSSMAAGSVMYLSLDFAETANSTIFTTTAPTSSVFSVGTNANANASGDRYVAYLFSTVAGVSKVGTYTGTGTTQQINCGFTGGARFVMIKRKDSTGDWYVWDSARGIVAGNDPYLLLNSTTAEVTGTDYIDTLSTGFEISSTAPAAINANGGSYIFLAIA